MIVLPPQRSFPHASYFSVQPALAWIVNHYFYHRVHYVWASQYLFPYRLLNPKSSNPLDIFRDLYQPCVDRDQYDAFVQQKRLNLRAGVEAVFDDSVKSNPSHSDHTTYTKLLTICDRIDVSFYWPMLYMIDHDAAEKKGEPANSGLKGSQELLIRDLQENEFALLLPDYDREPPFKDAVATFINGSFAPGVDALEALEDHV